MKEYEAIIQSRIEKELLAQKLTIALKPVIEEKLKIKNTNIKLVKIGWFSDENYNRKKQSPLEDFAEIYLTKTFHIQIVAPANFLEFYFMDSRNGRILFAVLNADNVNESQIDNLNFACSKRMILPKMFGYKIKNLRKAVVYNYQWRDSDIWGASREDITLNLTIDEIANISYKHFLDSYSRGDNILEQIEVFEIITDKSVDGN